jgi:hypothetical protein
LDKADATSKERSKIRLVFTITEIMTGSDKEPFRKSIQTTIKTEQEILPDP